MHITKGDTEVRCLVSLCTRIGSCFALKVKMLCDAGEYSQLADLSIDPNLYLNARAFADDYLIANFLSKWKGLQTGIDTRKRALDGWIAAERMCLLTNQVFRRELRGFPPRVESVLHLAQRKIASVLGPFKVHEVLAKCKWSNGATYDLRRGVSFANKMSERISVTSAASNYLKLAIESDPHWFEAISGSLPVGRFSLVPYLCFNIVRGSRFLTVPKSAKTDRCISAEPTGNAFLQQGVHDYMRHRLRRFGVDLDDQSINSQYACHALELGLCTVDLSSASDSISSMLVLDLLPFDWYLLLDRLRSKETMVEGEWRILSKFSSMGNAFTFELETLIFWALCASVNEIVGHGVADVCSVYGDDIIIPRTSFSLAKEVLETCGFKINISKTFVDGRFFESCGGHYFDGVDVTPVYQKEKTDTREELIRCYNRLARWSIRQHGFPFCQVVLKSLDILMGNYLTFKDKYVPRIPDGSTDDDGFLTDPVRLGVLDGNRGYRCIVYNVRPRFKGVSGSCFFAYKLRSPALSSSDSKGQGRLGTEGPYRYGIAYRHAWDTSIKPSRWHP